MDSHPNPNPATTAPSAVAMTNTAIAAATTTTNRTFTIAAAARPTSSISQTHPPRAAHHLHYLPQAIYPAQTLPIRVQNPQIPNKPAHQDPISSQGGIMYPVASSGRGFISRAIRPFPTDQSQTVTVANSPVGFPPRHVVTFPQGARPVGSPQLGHLMRPPNLLPQPPQHMHLGPIKGVPASANPKVVPPTTVAESNGYKESRDRSRDDTLAVVRGRKVRITEDASLYALCRSWLRNGFPEDIKVYHPNFPKALPKPLPLPEASTNMSKRKEDEEEEVDSEAIKNMSPKDLLQKHIKRAKRVRERFKEDRMRRIERYKARLALLLPPQVEQFRNDTPGP